MSAGEGEEPVMVFRPKPSFGWVWLVAVGAFVIASSVFTLAAESVVPVVVWAMELLILGLGVWFLVMAAMFPTMRYEVGEGELRMRYGPWTWHVQLADIRDVRRTDLAWTLWSSMRFPGFALFNVPYGAGVGTVRMCATRCATDVLLLDTGDARYGVTPEDEERFLRALGRPSAASGEARADRAEGAE